MTKIAEITAKNEQLLKCIQEERQALKAIHQEVTMMIQVKVKNEGIIKLMQEERRTLQEEIATVNRLLHAQESSKENKSRIISIQLTSKFKKEVDKIQQLKI